MKKKPGLGLLFPGLSLATRLPGHHGGHRSLPPVGLKSNRPAAVRIHGEGFSGLNSHNNSPILNLSMSRATFRPAW